MVILLLPYMLGIGMAGYYALHADIFGITIGLTLALVTQERIEKRLQ